MSDVRLYEADGDGGEIDWVNGRAVLDDGIYTAVYLSLWGGNDDDSGDDDGLARQWWGNLGEGEESRKYRSRTQSLLRALPAVPANIKRIEDAATSDLSWMVSERIATALSVVVGIPAMNRVRLTVNLAANGQAYSFTFEQETGEQD